MKSVQIPPFSPNRARIYTFDVPSSKSILNRALLLAGFSGGDVLVECQSYGEDTCAVLGALKSLGIPFEKVTGGILVHGCGGVIPNPEAHINVKSAGTCARFLPAILSSLGGNYFFDASEQMKKRPMDFLTVLQSAGVHIEFGGQQNAFPFRLGSNGFCRHDFAVNTDTSTQYASALLLAGAIGKFPLDLTLTGKRTQGGYIEMTLALLKSFGADWKRNGDTITVFPMKTKIKRYAVEADVSASCYFYALALLFHIKVLVRRIKKNSLQSDAKFFDLLEARGVRFCETDEGLLADGSGISSFKGFRENLCDYSDQALTVAALAPFADSKSFLTGIGHIRTQECDRIAAAEENLRALGVPCKVAEDGIEITPAPPKSGTIRSFGDHRVAMAFTLPALKTGNIAIDDGDCCRKSFSSFFTEIEKLNG